MSLFFFFFNDTATTEIYTLSLHDALPISYLHSSNLYLWNNNITRSRLHDPSRVALEDGTGRVLLGDCRSEEHTSELQSRQYLVCRLLLEKKKKHKPNRSGYNLNTKHTRLS